MRMLLFIKLKPKSRNLHFEPLPSEELAMPVRFMWDNIEF